MSILRNRAFVKANEQRKTELNWTQPSQLIAGFRPKDIALIGRSTRVCPDCEEPATTANFVAESSRIVTGRRRFNTQRETKLNSTVQLSSVLRCALGLRLLYG